MTGRRVK